MKTEKITGKSLLIWIVLLIPFFSTYGQDLENYQKLRGDIISSQPWPTEQQNNVPVYFHGYNAFDTNRSTAFKSHETGGWIGLDLKSDHSIRKVRVYPRSDKRERARGIIQGSSEPDFTNPVTLFTIAANPAPGRFSTYDITSDKTFRYVRLKAEDEYECNLMEIEFYTDSDSQKIEYKQLTNLPTIYIETKGQFDFVYKEEYKTGTIVVADGSGVKTYPAQVRGRGNSTWEFMEKKSIRIKFEKKQRFLGLPAHAKSWTLIASYTDKSFIRNGLAFEMSRIMNFEWTPSCTYADLVLDGCYYGTFAVCDQVQIHEDRINIDEMTPEDVSSPNITGGYHLEIDAYADQEPVYFKTKRGIPFTIKNPDDPCQPEQLNYIKTHIQRLEDLLYTDPQSACSRYIDLRSAVKYYLHSELTGNCDSYWCIPCYKKRGDDRIYFGPVWDFDQAFLNNQRVPLYYPTLDTYHGSAQPWFRIIMAQPEAKKILKEEWQNIQNQNMEQALYNYIDDWMKLLQESQVINYKRWDCLGRHVWFDDFQFPLFGDYMLFLKWVIKERFAWYESYMGDVLADFHHFLLASKPMNEKTEWRYIPYEDDDNRWYQESYDDSDWEIGPAPFGDRDNIQNTLWRTKTIQIRTEFEVEKEAYDRIKDLFICVFHDEDCVVYINGQEVLRLREYNHDWDAFLLNKEFLRPGKNLIAIKCTQTVGGQLIDAGIFASLTDDTGINGKMKNEKYRYSLYNNMLVIENTIPGTVLYLFSVDGKLITQVNVHDSKVEIHLPSKGIYLVKLPDQIFKIAN